MQKPVVVRSGGHLGSLFHRHHKLTVKSHWHSSHATHPCSILRLGRGRERARRGGKNGETRVKVELIKSLIGIHQQFSRAPNSFIHPATSFKTYQFTSSPCPVLYWIKGVRANSFVPTVQGHSVTLLSLSDRLERCWERGSVELHRLRSWTV